MTVMHDAAPAAPLTGRPWLSGSAIALGTLTLTTGPLYRIRTWWTYADPLAADVAVVITQLTVGAGALAVLVTAGRWRLVDRRFGIVAMGLVVWMGLGALWSADAGTTFRESVMVGVTLLAGLGAAVAVSEVVLAIAVWVGVQIGLAWSAVAIVFTRPGSQNADREWTGVYFNPNALALVATFGVLFAVVLALYVIDRTPPYHVGILAVLVASVVADVWLLTGTDALAPVVGLVGGSALAAGAVAARRWFGRDGRHPVDARRLTAGVGIGLVGLGALGWWLRDEWVSAVGRTSDLTGRTAMWEVAIEWFRRRPLVGQGYLGAWSDPDFAADMFAARGVLLGSTHNTFVELLLGTGVIGVALIVAVFAIVWVNAGERTLIAHSWFAAWPLAAAAFLVAENLAETLWVGGQLAVAALGVLAVVSARAPTIDQPAQAAPGSPDARRIVDVE